ncbi:MAG: hypothetical protein KAJ20_02905, partial [Candidatus Aenigmarchaeota archaeon]|nr:hypothetical protein [Candidatus Aenigmarchaeota archaeon]MCK5373261.1 hypothetical protein [Candidatus Aenigmarchaeota archaeon]
PSFMEYYNTDSDVKVSSVYAEEGIPLEISSKEPFHKNVSGIFKDRINYLSGMLSGNNGNNGRKLIFLDDYKKNIDYDALESLLESFNPQRSLDTLGFDFSFDNIDNMMFNCLDLAFLFYSLELISGKENAKAQAKRDIVSLYRKNLKNHGMEIYDMLKSDVDWLVDDIFNLDNTLDLPKDTPAKLMICSRKEDGSKEMLASFDYFGNSKYSATILIENKHLSEADLLLASGLVMKYMDHFGMPMSESNQKRIIRYIKNANFLKDNLHYINYMLMVGAPIPTSSKQEQVPALI